MFTTAYWTALEFSKIYLEISLLKSDIQKYYQLPFDVNVVGLSSFGFYLHTVIIHVSVY